MTIITKNILFVGVFLYIDKAEKCLYHYNRVVINWIILLYCNGVFYYEEANIKCIYGIVYGRKCRGHFDEFINAC